MKKTFTEYAEDYKEYDSAYASSLCIGYIFYLLNISEISSFNGYDITVKYNSKEMKLVRIRWSHCFDLQEKIDSQK